MTTNHIDPLAASPQPLVASREPSATSPEPLKVLLATSTRWISTARLGMALAAAGWTVEAMCRSGHPLSTTSVTPRRHSYSDFRPLQSLRRALTIANPDLLICCDERVLRLAHELFRRADATAQDRALRPLLERSLGDPEHYGEILSRTHLMEAAAKEGFRIPATATIERVADLAAAGASLGWPLVLKTDGSSGGTGVRLAGGRAEADRLWRRLRRAPGPLRALHRALLDRELTRLVAMLRGQRHTVVAQRFVPGMEATVAVACWRGEILAAHCMEVVETWSPRGPSSVLRLIDSVEMLAVVRQLVRRLGLSGLCGFDFILESGTGKALLIEMNARPTQACHLPLGAGRDLIAAISSAVRLEVAGEASEGTRPAVTDEPIIVLFPQEWERDPQSRWIQQGFHDVPWSEPKLLRAALTDRFTGWYGRTMLRKGRR